MVASNIGRFLSGLLPPRNKSTLNAFINIIFLYSAMKNRANGPPAYSTLYPDTSSDSPSVRSNGARLVSANEDMNHIKDSGTIGSKNHIDSCMFMIFARENELDQRRTDNSISPSLIS